MVKFNPVLSQFSSTVFSSKNMQLEVTKYCGASTTRYSNDNTKWYLKQCIGMLTTKKEQNFELWDCFRTLSLLLLPQDEAAVQFGTADPVSRQNYAIAFKENFFGGVGVGGGGIYDES